MPHSVDHHSLISGSVPDLYLSSEEELELSQWYADHYPFKHINGGICHCIIDTIDEIIAWRNGDPDLQTPDVIEPPQLAYDPNAPIEDWDLPNNSVVPAQSNPTP